MAQNGQTGVATAGTAVRLAASSELCNGPVLVKALPVNSGVMYLGGPGVNAANGLPLAKGEWVTFCFIGDLNQLWLDASVNGEKVAWIKLEG
jgi:hypothetical protein